MAIIPVTPVSIARKVKALRIVGDIAYVPLVHGVECIIDAADAWLIENRNWSLANGYAVARIYVPGAKSQCVSIHRIIVGAGAGKYVDHIDCDRLNNRRSNLRICTHAENLLNRPAPKGNKTGFKGVSICKQTGKFRAIISVRGVIHRIGRFDTPEVAAAAYDAVAKEKCGEFARLNFG